jgi:GrpB-like predicted nucleotidyltransferase (UPF0157 family)
LTRRVELFDYDPRWPDVFETERARLEAAIGPHVVAIEHIGSTSVPRLAAKPVVDIGVAVEEFFAARVCILPIKRLGYRYKGQHGIPRRHFFYKGERTHHLHMLETSSGEWHDLLDFRDWLRADAETARAYEALKRALAERHRDQVEDYAHAKTDFVREALSRARREGGGRR